MSDRETIEDLLRLVPRGKFQIDNDICLGVHLFNESDIWGGLARHSKEKRKILKLISKLENLRYLDLRKNRFGPITDLGLQKLEYVDLASNYMTEIPKWLKNCPLKYLNLGVNEISNLPDWISEFKQLIVLKLHKNQIKNADSIYGLNNLNFLNLYFNQMKAIPSFVWQIKQLEFFSWGVSAIKTLPKEISNLNNLKWLSMVGNKIEELPDEFCQLFNLVGVRLHKNRLHKLPENIGNLQKIEQLTLYHNRLSCLPESFQKLNLKKLNLAHNQFNSKPNIKSEWMCYEAGDCLWY